MAQLSTLGHYAHAMKRWFYIFSAVFVIAAVVFIVSLPALKRHAELMSCSNQMHAVLFTATLLWPDDHDGHLPSDFLSMSNELGTPKVLVCPGDHLHQPATSWASFTTNNCSYEIVSTGLLKSDTNRIFMRCSIHGYVGYADDRLLDASGRLIRPNRLW